MRKSQLKKINKIFNRMMENRENFMQLANILHAGIPPSDFKRIFGPVAKDMMFNENQIKIRRTKMQPDNPNPRMK